MSVQIPAWLGMVLGIVIGVVAVIVGAVTGTNGFIPFGLWAAVASVIAFADGASAAASPDGSISPFEVKLDVAWSSVRAVAWLIIAGLFVAAVIASFWI